MSVLRKISAPIFRRIPTGTCRLDPIPTTVNGVRSVRTEDIPLADEAVYFRDRAIKAHGEEAKHEKTFPIWEWKRISYVLSRLKPAESFMEVGPGRGHFTRVINRSERFSSLSAIDIVERKALPSKVDFRICSVVSIDAADKSYDAVVCMEVLEHLEDEECSAGLAEIRRICRGLLIVSVPFDEHPLPRYHKQSFSEKRINQLFPTAEKTILVKPDGRTPWIILEENHGSA